MPQRNSCIMCAERYGFMPWTIINPVLCFLQIHIIIYNKFFLWLISYLSYRMKAFKFWQNVCYSQCHFWVSSRFSNWNGCVAITWESSRLTASFDTQVAFHTEIYPAFNIVYMHASLYLEVASLGVSRCGALYHGWEICPQLCNVNEKLVWSSLTSRRALDYM